MAWIIILLLALLAVFWIVLEPITGILGSTFIAKIVAVIAAFKILCWMLASVGF